MPDFNSILEWINGNIIWGSPMIILLLGTGLYLGIKTKFFSIRHLGLALKRTVFSLFSSKNKKASKGGITQFQAISTALAATIGTGNIAGVASAITLGGAGAVFWMWISALLGMTTAYAENLLGIYYRTKNSKNEFCGGAMYYLTEGLKGKRFLKHFKKPLAFSFAFFCMLASLGMGNMTQVNTVSSLLENGIFGIKIPTAVTAAVLTVIIGLVVFGGIHTICRITEKLVPISTLLYILGTLLIIFINLDSFGDALIAIFKGAFGLKPALGGAAGYGIKKAMEIGMRRGVFSNEAGLGSAVIVGAASDVTEPAVQGMWGIFTVFFDTIIGCSLTAFALLTSGVYKCPSLEGANMVAAAFSSSLGAPAGDLVALFTLLFALATVMGWSFYGIKCALYLFGEKSTFIYKLIFVLAVIPGSVLRLDTIWLIADAFNGLMAVPNLIALLCLKDKIIIITNNYILRTIKGKTYLPPLISAYPDIQNEQEKNVEY